MTQKPAPGADLLLTLWVAVVAVVFFGPIFIPDIGFWTAPAGLLSLGMVGAAAVTLALRVVHRRDGTPMNARTEQGGKNRKRR